MKAYRGVEMWLHAFLSFAPVKVSVQLHALDALTPGMGLGGPQSQSGLLEE